MTFVCIFSVSTFLSLITYVGMALLLKKFLAFFSWILHKKQKGVALNYLLNGTVLMVLVAP